MSEPLFEYRVEDESGWFLDRETGKTAPWDGIRIIWRAKGERLWRKLVIVPDDELGQTVEGLKADAEEIVRAAWETTRA